MDQTEGIGMPILLVAGIIGMLLLSIAIILFFLIYQKRLLAQQSELLRLESEYQKGLLNATIQTQEAERKRIAADLHDSVGSLLSATKLYMRQIKHGQTVEKFDHVKTEALGLIEETIVNIRSITQNLSPQSLERFGLIAAVEDLCERLNDLEQLQIDFYYNVDKRFDTEQEVVLYRILQELLNNTFKHAEAAKVQIEFLFKNGQLHLKYKDDGKGFEWDQTTKKQKFTGGLGMKSIESRANFLNAQLEVKSAPGIGVDILLEMDVH